MDLKGFIEQALTQEREALMETISDLSPQELAWRSGPEANHIGWILWHTFRVEDMWIQFFIQKRNESWERDGWNEWFGLPTRDNGFGHTAEQVAGFPALELQQLLEYARAVREQTLDYLRGLAPEDFDLVPRERRPETSVGVVFRLLVAEFHQHQGQVAYLKGLLRSEVVKG